jgi:hypothetical protein
VTTTANIPPEAIEAAQLARAAREQRRHDRDNILGMLQVTTDPEKKLRLWKALSEQLETICVEAGLV